MLGSRWPTYPQVSNPLRAAFYHLPFLTFGNTLRYHRNNLEGARSLLLARLIYPLSAGLNGVFLPCPISTQPILPYCSLFHLNAQCKESQCLCCSVTCCVSVCLEVWLCILCKGIHWLITVRSWGDLRRATAVTWSSLETRLINLLEFIIMFLFLPLLPLQCSPNMGQAYNGKKQRPHYNSLHH